MLEKYRLMNYFAFRTNSKSRLDNAISEQERLEVKQQLIEEISLDNFSVKCTLSLCHRIVTI